MAKTLAQLLDAPDETKIKTSVLSKMQSATTPLPTASWASGSIPRTNVETTANGLAQLWEVVENIAEWFVLDLSTGDGLTLYADQRYNLTRTAASYTVGTIQIYVASGNGPYTITANQLWFQGAGTNRYNSTSTGTLATVGFTASPMTLTGVGPGTITPTASGSVPTNYRSADQNGKSYRVLIVTGGVANGATATYRLSSDGGTTYSITRYANSAAAFTDPETGIILTFQGGGIIYTAADTYNTTAGGQLNVTVQSEFKNDSLSSRNYIDANSTITTLLTPLPGVTTRNFPGLLSSVTLSGSSTGTLEVRPKTYAAITAATVDVEITTSGQIGAAVFQFRIDGGSWVTAQTISAVAAPELTRGVNTHASLTAINVELWFSNGSANPSFVDGDTFTFTAPASWITTQGTDEQSDASLRLACKNQWSTLSPIPTNPLYEVWAKAGSTQVTRVRVALSTTVNNKVIVTVGGQGGAVAASVVTTVQTYINARKPLTDVVLAQNASVQAITLGGATVRVKQAALAVAQSKAQTNVANYIASVGFGDGSTVKVILSQVIEAILRESGAETDSVNSLTINGAATDYVLAADTIPTWSQVLSSALTWTAY